MMEAKLGKRTDSDATAANALKVLPPTRRRKEGRKRRKGGS
jgi:hypothetical protein